MFPMSEPADRLESAYLDAAWGHGSFAVAELWGMSKPLKHPSADGDSHLMLGHPEHVEYQVSQGRASLVCVTGFGTATDRDRREPRLAESRLAIVPQIKDAKLAAGSPRSAMASPPCRCQDRPRAIVR